MACRPSNAFGTELKLAEDDNGRVLLEALEEQKGFNNVKGEYALFKVFPNVLLSQAVASTMDTKSRSARTPSWRKILRDILGIR
jgi:hypothetical protein